MRETSRESSPALGGVIIGVVMMGSLVYAMGYGGQAANLAGGTLSHLLDIMAQAISAAANAVRDSS